MESSSENSFTWTDTTSDSSDSHSKITDGSVLTKNEMRKTTKKLSNSICNGTADVNNTKEVKIKKEKFKCKTNNDSLKQNMVKLESESDSDIQRKKKKKKKNSDVRNETQESPSYDESYLNLKVKQEEISALLPSKKNKRKHSMKNESASTDVEQQEISDSLPIKKKKRKHSDMNENALTGETVLLGDSTDAHELKTSQNIEYDAGHGKSKKKKNKSKKRRDSEAQDDFDSKKDIVETVLDHKRTSSIAETSLKETTFDETGCDEISAIHCEDDRDLHTISFVDGKSVQNDCKKSNSLYKTTITNQFKTDQHNGYRNTHVLSASDRTSSISDRIRFEDDSETEFNQIYEKERDQISTKLKKFVKTMNFRVTSQELQQSSVFTHNDEIWIIKCPQDIDVRAFNGSDLNIQEKCKIKVGGQTYDGSLGDDQCDTVAALSMGHSKYEIVPLTLSGIINIRKRIPKPHFHDDNIMVNNQTNFIPLPETKCRHPLLGSNYKKALKISSAVAERLNPQNREEAHVIKEKRKKKKHKKDKSQQEYEETDAKSEVRVVKPEPDLTLQVTEKKRKKRKHDNDDGPAPKKTKRTKHDPDSAEVWDSEKAIGENLFNF